MDWEKYAWIIYTIIIGILFLLLCYIGYEKNIKTIISNKNKIQPVNTNLKI